MDTSDESSMNDCISETLWAKDGTIDILYATTTTVPSVRSLRQIQKLPGLHCTTLHLSFRDLMKNGFMVAKQKS